MERDDADFDQETATEISSSDRLPNIERRLAWTIGLALAAIFFCRTVSRSVPGGPFISITSNVVPAILACVAITVGLPCLRSRKIFPRFVAMLFILLATVTLAATLVDVYTFWHRPYARGRLFGF